MAFSKNSKRSEEDDEVRGYICNISPVKLSKNERTRYFTGEIQMSKETTTRLVCFSAEKHKAFKAAELSTAAFHLKDASIQPGRSGMEVKVNNKTRLEKASKSLNFKKSYKTLVQCEDATISELKINNIDQEYQMASVNVKYYGVEEDREVNTKSTIEIVTIADQTEVRKLVIWAEELRPKLVPGNFYCFFQASVNVKYYGVEEDREVNTKYGKSTIEIVTIADQTEVRKLVIWAEELRPKLVPGNFYCITSLQNRYYDNKFQLPCLVLAHSPLM